jgi:glycerophosphoryl diester phosphodiesterase
VKYKRIAIRFSLFLLGAAALIMSAIYGSLACADPGSPAAEYAVFKQNDSQASAPLVMAHRGGAGIGPENTLPTFESAAAMGVDVIEIDVHGTADGHLVVIHDGSVDRTTNGSGRVNEMTLDQLKKLDAGFRWSKDGGQSFPFRERGVQIPTLQEVFAAFPKMKFNVEPKQRTPSIIKPLCQIIREKAMSDKIVVGSFSQTVLDEFRAACPEVATSASPTEVSKFLAMYKTGVSESYSPPMQALQVPERAGLQIVSPEFVKAAHERNLKVHVWTVNETESMRRLLDMGVDGIITDYPDRLLHMLGRTSPSTQTAP